MTQEPNSTTNHQENNDTNTQEEKEKEERKSLWGKLELIKYNPIKTNPKQWQCNIGTCQTRGITPQNMANHIARTNKQENVRICRKKTYCPLCNKEYSNLNALLIHLEIRNIQMAWKTQICEILQQKILPPEHNTAKYKWNLTQQHNRGEI